MRALVRGIHSGDSAGEEERRSGLRGGEGLKKNGGGKRTKNRTLATEVIRKDLYQQEESSSCFAEVKRGMGKGQKWQERRELAVPFV